MQYRRLGRTGLNVSTISLGTEHLLGQPPRQTEELLRLAVEVGVNYFDLVFSHQELRDLIAGVLRDRRQQVFYAVHLGSIVSGGQYEKTRNPVAAARFFQDFLDRFKTDMADILFLHSSDGQEDYEQLFGPDGLYELARSYKKEGRTRFLGFSGHTVSTAIQAIRRPEIDVLMFPINLASHAVQGKRELLEECRISNVAVVAMKPFAGGKLMATESLMTLEHWQSGGHEYSLERRQTVTPVQCIGYALAQPGVAALVPGFKTAEELKVALRYFTAGETETDFSGPLRSFHQYKSGECVYCNHCLPCPAEIDIAAVMKTVDEFAKATNWQLHSGEATLREKVDECIECGACEERCPFGVPIISRLRNF